ncbi:hypothetical protein [Hymenobacter arizonensis]|uniref:Uncharacterized protein n=1 Tax=Hymenobacter arizonensis TaxID=1227077 RepID=A0A1I5ZSL9_HYMAR|nr:hypothetical protein [Hymenobacter arizonensis]SFQ59187.1 hypothetical protein SAMN04515668_3164 [Hymenobacter arizonensis]
MLLGLNLALHAPFFWLLPNSAHVWRQCNTMAVARNPYEKGMNPLHPSVDRCLDTNGVTGANFPSYELLVAGSYQLFGFDTPQQLASPAWDGSARPYLKACVARGARFLYTNDTSTLDSPTVRPYLVRQVSCVGEFQVWALKLAQ